MTLFPMNRGFGPPAPQQQQGIINPQSVMAALQGVGSALSGKPRNFFEGLGAGIMGSTQAQMNLSQLSNQMRQQALSNEIRQRQLAQADRQLAQKDREIGIKEADAGYQDFSTIATTPDEAAAYGIAWPGKPIEIKGRLNADTMDWQVTDVNSIGSDNIGEGLTALAGAISGQEAGALQPHQEELFKKVTAPQLAKDRETVPQLTEQISNYDTLEFALERGAQTGGFQPYIQELRRFADDLGFLSPEQRQTMDDTQLFIATANYLTPRIRPEGSGQTSDFEFKAFQRALPNIGSSETGNLQLIRIQRAMAQRKLEEIDFREDYAYRKGHLRGVNKEMQEELGPFDFGLPRIEKGGSTEDLEPGQWYIEGTGKESECKQVPDASGEPMTREEAEEFLSTGDPSDPRMDEVLKQLGF